ncbi:MAG TPA: GGDEF domain-containing protein [Candidatus Saccharimonadales bacterium]|nr:GGDEF domain-containing protein [Candidatus Saccharimonadales bacterium]
MSEVTVIPNHTASVEEVERHVAELDALLQPLPPVTFDTAEEQIAQRNGHLQGHLTAEGYLRWHDATHDNMTGLANRILIMQRIESCVDSKPGDFSLLFMDLDGLKEANDTLGHSAGDLLITRAAVITEESVRLHDERRSPDFVARIPARLGGDEFAVLLPDVGSQEDLNKIIDRLQENLKAAGIKASIGGRPHQTGETAAELLSAVDHIMYVKKIHNKLESLSPEQRLAFLEISRIATEYALNLRDAPTIISALQEEQNHQN